jgi:hypothetical protein
VVASAPRITLMESTEGLVVWFNHNSNNNIMMSAQGKFLTRASDSADLWASWTSGGAWSAAGVPSSILTPAAAFGIPAYYDASSQSPKPCYYTGNQTAGTVKQFGRINSIVSSSIVDTGLGVSGDPCTLLPIVCADSAQANTQNERFIGYLRQIRLGPVATHRQSLRDTAAGSIVVAKALHGSASAGLPVWFDEVQ